MPFDPGPGQPFDTPGGRLGHRRGRSRSGFQEVAALTATIGVFLLLEGCASQVWFPNVHPSRPVSVSGSLYRPQGSGKFPALVLSHGCGGIMGQVDWAWWLATQDYVALAVDHFAGRGITNECVPGVGSVPDRLWDLLGGAAYLRSLPFVDQDRIGIMGWSLGGMVALRVARDMFARNAPGLRAVVAFYPGGCGGELGSDTIVPILLLLGEADDWTSTQACVQVAREIRENGRVIEWEVFPQATHGFDMKQLGNYTSYYLGHALRYSPWATAEAMQRIQGFLGRHLRGGP